MRPQDDIDYTTLAWVKGELDETLNQARQALEAYVEDPADVSQMRFCATYLHQVQGTLRMVELYGAAMVTEEMEHLAAALLDGAQIGDRDEAYSVLMRGIMQLPDYLERLQTGHKDIPIVLLPLLNDLRAARGEKGLSEIALFTPDLGRDLPGAAQGPAQPLPEAELRSRAEQLRAAFQISLLKWFRNDDVDANLTRLTETCDKLVGLTAEVEARRLFWVTAGVLEALRAKSFEPSPQLKQTVGKVEREIKRLADVGEKSFRTDPPRELTRNLLYFVAHAPTQHGRIGEMRNVFNLGALLPSEAEVEHARSSLTGHNRSLLDTVSGAIKEDLMRVKDALDLHLRNPEAEAAQLASQIEVLERVSDTLGMLGLGVARRVVQEQRDAVQSVINGARPADESTLLDIAGALLYVEASLDDQVQHLGGMPSASVADGDAAAVLPNIETRRVMQALVKEAQTNFTRAKECFIGFIESSWDAEQLRKAPELLDQVAGALRIVELPEPAGYLSAIGRFTERELLENRRVPDVVQMETLADALASLEYFLEAQAEQRPGRERILHTARGSLEKLGYWPLPDLVQSVADAPDEAVVAPSPVMVDVVSDQEELVDAASLASPFGDVSFDATAAFVQATEPVIAEAVVESAPVAPTIVPEEVSAVSVPAAQAPEPVAAPVASSDQEGPIVGGFEAASEEIDEEIREVFIEEVAEEIDNLTELLPLWTETPTHLDQLKSIRRVFHTLKGSGRLVGAMTLGEFSWKVENMLNRVLDHTIQPTAPVIVLVQAAHGVLPEILAALRGERSIRTDLEAIKDVADRLSAGEQVHYAPAPVVVSEPVLPVQEPVEEVIPAEIEAVATEDISLDITFDAPESTHEEVLVDAAPALSEVATEADDDRVVVPAIDSVLFDILKPEVSGHLDTVDAYLAAGPHPVTDELVRAVHTMNGAFAMTEVPIVTEITAPLESYLKRALAQSATPTPQGFRALGDAVSALRNVLEELDAPSPRLTSLSDLAARIAAERDELPEALGPTGALYLAGEFEESTALTTAVSLDVTAVDTETEFLANIEQDNQQAIGDAVGDDLVDEALDIAALDALGEESMALDSIGLEGLDVEVAAFLAEEDAGLVTDAQGVAEEITQAPVAVEMGGMPEAVESVEWLDLAARDTDQDIVIDVPMLDVVEQEVDDFGLVEQGLPDAQAPLVSSEDIEIHRHDVAMLSDDLAAETSVPESDEITHEMAASPSYDDVIAAFTQAVDEASALDVPASLDMDAVIRDWLAGEPTQPEEVLTEERPSEETQLEAVAAPAEDFSLDVAEDEAAQDEAPVSLVATQWEGAGTVSADTFFEETLEAALPVADAGVSEDVTADEPVIEEEESFDFRTTEAIEEMIFVGTGEVEAVPAYDGIDIERADDDGLVAAFEQVVEAGDVEIHGEIGTEEVERVTALEVATTTEPVEEASAQVQAEAAPAMMLDSAADARIAAWFLAGLDGADTDPEEPLLLADMDEELLDIFAEEAADILDHSDGYMVQLREAPGDQEAVVALQRDLHTLKGGARMAGLNPIGDLGHVMESLLEIVAEGRRELPGYGVDVLEVAFDRLNRMTARVAARQAVATPVLLIQRVDMLARGDVPELGALAPEQANAAEQATEVLQLPDVPMVESPAVVAPPALAPEAVPTALDDEDIAVRAPQEQIRIRADLLDRLVNYAGEVAIYRARLEQQLGLFRGNLTELEQTNERLRGQLRKLEIETEAQIVARYQREAEVGGEQAFDPLELDRFSTLQQLTRALSESAADLVNLQGTLEDHTRQYETLLLQQSRVSSDLQEGLMRTRMVPFDSLVPRMRRIIRQTSAELGKKAQLKVEGAQGEMDRSVLDRMTAPLEHMLRNCLAHGLESPEERIAAGKPDEGAIKVAVLREGSEVVIKVTDDGRGLNRDAIRRKAIERGLLAADAKVSDRELYNFILAAGFSTATTVSKVAGRGVGMDVVHSEIRQLGGTLNIESQPGKGSVFTIRLPFTLAVTQAVFVQQGETSYAVPIASVQGVARIDRAGLDAQLASGEPRFVYAGENYQIHDLGRLLGQAPVRAEESLQIPLLLARSGDLRVAICVDNVIGSREIVVKPVGAQVSSIPGIFGATIMGDGRVIVILDVAPLARRYAAQHHDGLLEPLAPAEPVRRVPLVMVVDDSITMRKVTGRVLDRHGYEVLTAKDGVDAVEKLADRVPDVMLLDIEMPRMDGYELATHIRNDVRLRGIPIIMITSRTGEKHRQRAFEIGVDRYLGKPYQEADLMRNVEEILKVQRGDLG